jgi:putative transposase
MPKNLKRFIGRGDLHFIHFTCYQRRPLLGSVKARNLAVKILGEVRARYGFSLLGYVIMPEHVHLLMSELPTVLPARIVQVFKQRVSRQMRGRKRVLPGQLGLPFPKNARDLRRFWQRRYFDFNVYSEKKLREKLDYMHMNPVKERLVKHPRGWPWSSWTFYERGEGLLAMDKWE